jgi:hypothetical protein
MIGLITRVFVRGPEGEKKFFNDGSRHFPSKPYIRRYLYIYKEENYEK